VTEPETAMETEAARAEIPRGRLVLYVAPLAAFTVVSTIGAAFMPYFLARMPLVLIAMSPLFRHMVLVAPSVDSFSLFAVAVPRHFAPDPFMYFLGRDYGPAAIEWVENNSPFAGRFVRTLEKIFAKIGVFALLVSPDLLVSTLAGAARVPFPLFLAFNLAGTFATVWVAEFFGDALTREIGMVTAFFKGHLALVTAVSVLLIIGLNWWSRRGAASGSGAGGASGAP
jgi:membrane protein DedA with SNARE-associated domain